MPTLLRWAVTGGLLLRAMVVRFLLPPRPEFLVSRRTPFADDTNSEDSSAAVLLVRVALVAEEETRGCHGWGVDPGGEGGGGLLIYPL